MAIKLIVTDLDGTLLTDEKLISDRNKAAIAAAEAAGVMVTVATGRMCVAAAHYARRIGVTLPIVSCNGGLVRAYTGKAVFTHCFTRELAREVIALCYDRDWNVQWYIDDKVYVKKFNAKLFRGYNLIDDFAVTEIGNDFESYLDDVIQIVIRDLDGNIGNIQKCIYEKFQGHLTVQQNTEVSVDIDALGINKSVGIEVLINELGITKDEVMAFGDADNDIEMLKYVGVGVAMGNAIAAVKEVADIITEDNEHDGVAVAIEKYILNKYSL